MLKDNRYHKGLWIVDAFQIHFQSIVRPLNPYHLYSECIPITRLSLLNCHCKVSVIMIQIISRTSCVEI